MCESLGLRTSIILGVLALFGIITFALVAATLGTVNKQYSELKDIINVPTTAPPLNSILAQSIRIADVMVHLNELQRIATAANETRAIGTAGFNRTLDYITTYLNTNTDYNVIKTYFPVRDFALNNNPILISSINGEPRTYTYSTNLSIAEFYHAKYSTSLNLPNFLGLIPIPNVGCLEDDWQRANAAGRVAIVKRGTCTFRDKAAFAMKYNVTALLFYNDGISPDNIQPIEVSLAQNNTLPALVLSFTVGSMLYNASQYPLTNTSVRLVIDVQNRPDLNIGNICADTPTGNATQTIVIGSHTDSVPAGPGINDNGSGTAANLALAVALARLFQTSTYAKYKYRIRFCWWGAEEVGLLGSDYHVKQAKNSNIEGERLSDYLINLNYDMLGTPNYIFGIYDGKTANNNTPSQALPGSNKITALFRDWFIGQNLPWDYTDFSGRSDYGPFLAEGIVAGGLFSGADEIKTREQRDRYDQILGQGMGGIAGIVTDPCYHKACDSIQNINLFAYEKMVQAAAYVLEVLGQQADLKTWLYPNGIAFRAGTQLQRQAYDSINEYFGLPYV